MAVVTAFETDSVNFHPAVENPGVEAILAVEAFLAVEVFLLWERSDRPALAAQSAS